MDIEQIPLIPTAVGNLSLHRNRGGEGSLLELPGDGNRVEVSISGGMYIIQHSETMSDKYKL